MFSNGSVLLAYRGGGDGVALGGGIGIAYSTHWNQSVFHRVGEGKMLFSAEDAILWREKQQYNGEDTYTYHMLVHRFASGNGSTSGIQVGGHAFSLNGFSNYGNTNITRTSLAFQHLAILHSRNKYTLYVEYSTSTEYCNFDSLFGFNYSGCIG